MTEIMPVVAAFLPLAVFAGVVLTLTAQWIVRRWP
jgi:hypothetical protein